MPTIVPPPPPDGSRPLYDVVVRRRWLKCMDDPARWLPARSAGAALCAVLAAAPSCEGARIRVWRRRVELELVGCGEDHDWAACQAAAQAAVGPGVLVEVRRVVSS